MIEKVKIIVRGPRKTKEELTSVRRLRSSLNGAKSDFRKNMARTQIVLLSMMGKAECVRCGETKPTSSFPPCEKSLGGVERHCTQCQSKQRTQRRSADPETRRRDREANTRWRNKDGGKAHRERQAQYRIDNPEKVKETARKQRQRPVVKFRRRKYEYIRRARMKSIEGSHTFEQMKARFDYYENKCAYCGCDGKMTIDHKIPICKGGTNWASNIVPACRSCNSAKGGRMGFLEFKVYTDKKKRTA